MYRVQVIQVTLYLQYIRYVYIYILFYFFCTYYLWPQPATCRVRPLKRQVTNCQRTAWRLYGLYINKTYLKKSRSLLSKPHCATKLGPSSIGRTVLAMLLVMAKKGVWVLEQPSSSLVFRLKRFQDHLVGKTRASYLYSTFWGLAGCWFEHVIYIYL